MISAPIIIGVLAVLFVTMGIVRAVGEGSISHPRTRTWLLVGAIFSVMSAYAFLQM
jgi:hypothetical protein